MLSLARKPTFAVSDYLSSCALDLHGMIPKPISSHPPGLLRRAPNSSWSPSPPIFRPGLSCTFGGLQSARSSTVHLAYINISSRVAPYHLPCIAAVVPLRGTSVKCSPCLVPPAGAPATAVTLKNASDKCIADAAFCLGWMYALTSRHWPR